MQTISWKGHGAVTTMHFDTQTRKEYIFLKYGASEISEGSCICERTQYRHLENIHK